MFKSLFLRALFAVTDESGAPLNLPGCELVFAIGVGIVTLPEFKPNRGAFQMKRFTKTAL